MAFSEKIKIEVKRRSAFQCCRCRTIGVQIHHIIQGGSDTIDNAAPLCPNCHDYFGQNPVKRKEIKQMRDWWYEVCDEKYSESKMLDELKKINDKIEQLESMDKKEAKEELKNKILEELRTQTKKEGVNNIANLLDRKSKNLATATRLGNGVYADFQCKKCGKRIGLLIGKNECPNCGEPIK